MDPVNNILSKDLSLSEAVTAAQRILADDPPSSAGYMAGESGILVFFAFCQSIPETLCPDLSALLSDDRFIKRKENAILRMKDHIQNEGPDPEIAFSLSEGVFGILHALYLIEKLSHDKASAGLIPLYLEKACTFEPETGVYPDVYFGLSGIINVLAEYLCDPALFFDKALLKDLSDILVRCLDRLVELADKDSGSFIWDTLRSKTPVSGYGHGMLGIGCAILKGLDVLSSKGLITDDKKQLFMKAADDTFSFELNSYSTDLCEWPDLRPGKAPSISLHGICSGAPGTALGVRFLIDRSRQAKKLYTLSCQSIINNPLTKRDHLCCGKAGSAYFFLSDPPLIPPKEASLQAGHILYQMITEKNTKNARYCLPDLPYPENENHVSLFFGLSGIAAVLLSYSTGLELPTLLP